MFVRPFVGLVVLLIASASEIGLCERGEGNRKVVKVESRTGSRTHLRSAHRVEGKSTRSIGHNATAAGTGPNHIGKPLLRHHKGSSDQLFMNKGGRLSLASNVKAIQCQGTPCVYKGNCAKEACCQDELHRLLTTAADLMEKSKIPYYLTAGTLLGAIREKDIIPYTADVDIYLSSDSIAQLLKAAQGSEMAVGPDDWGVGVYRGCENNDGEASRAFTDSDRTLPYIDFYAIDKFKEFDKNGTDLDVAAYMKGSNKATIREREYPIPEQAESLLVKWYGTDWKVPAESAHFTSK